MKAHRASVSDSGAYVAYARVSSKEQDEEGYSVPAQLRAIRDYAAKHGIEVAREFVEAETAKVSGRRAFGDMLKFVRDQGVAGILVEKTDRLYRNFSDFVKVDELGVDLHFVKEGQVIKQDSHSSEKLMHSIKVCLAKNYIDNLSEEIRKGMREKALQGIYPTHAPLGYVNVPDGHRKKIVPDPVRAPLVARLFEVFALGRMSISEATKYAYEIGLRTKKGNKLHKSSVATMLRCEVYVGKLRWNGETLGAIHEPLVGADAFYRVQEILDRRTSRLGYGTVEIGYRGVVRCSKCGSVYSGEVKKGKYVYYHCTGRQSGCQSGYVKEEVFTRAFCKLLDSIRIPEPILEVLRTAMIQASQDEERFAAAQRTEAEKSVKASIARLATLYEDKIDGALSAETYERLRAKYEADLAQARVQAANLDNAGSVWRDDGLRILELAASASDRFKQASPEDKRSLLQNLYSNCVFDGQKLHIELRPPFDLILKCTSEQGDQKAGEETKNGISVDWWRIGDSNP
jgi:site-specific DNA recombinase